MISQVTIPEKGLDSENYRDCKRYVINECIPQDVPLFHVRVLRTYHRHFGSNLGIIKTKTIELYENMTSETFEESYGTIINSGYGAISITFEFILP